MPKISIIVPVYNLENHLENTVKALTNQDEKDIEIILVNDGSTDKSGEVCEALQKKDGRIAVLHTENRGVSAARNAGIRLACGEFIGFCDGDDIPHRDMYSSLYNLAVKNGCQVVTAQTKIVFDDGSTSTTAKNRGEIIWDSKNQFMTEFLQGTFGFGVCKMLFKAELAKTIDFEYGRKINEDKMYVFEALQKSDTVGFIDKALYDYHRRSSSASYTEFSDKFFDAIYFADKIHSIIKKQYPDLSDYSLLGLARAHLEILKLMVLENGISKFPTEWKKSIGFLKALDKKFCKKYFSKNEQIKMTALRINPKCFMLAVNAFSKN